MYVYIRTCILDFFQILSCFRLLQDIEYRSLCYTVQFSSVAQSCPTLCDPVDWSMPGFPVHHQLVELAQTHVHQVGDAIQPSYPLSSPSPAFSLSHHQGNVLYSGFLLSVSYVVVCICLSSF